MLFLGRRFAMKISEERKMVVTINIVLDFSEDKRCKSTICPSLFPH